MFVCLLHLNKPGKVYFYLHQAERGAYTPYNYDQQQQQGGDPYGAQGQGFDPYAQQRQGMYSGDSYEDPYDAVELTGTFALDFFLEV